MFGTTHLQQRRRRERKKNRLRKVQKKGGSAISELKTICVQFQFAVFETEQSCVYVWVRYGCSVHKWALCIQMNKENATNDRRSCECFLDLRRNARETENEITGIITEIKFYTTRKYAMWLRVALPDHMKWRLSEEKELNMANNGVIVACKWPHSLHKHISLSIILLRLGSREVLRSAKCEHFVLPICCKMMFHSSFLPSCWGFLIFSLF